MNKDLDYIFPNPPHDANPADLKVEAIPEHIAIIMDGNGRWAQRRGKVRLQGHSAGIEAVREAIRTSSDLGVRYLTIYSFSSENWKRPQDEVTGLMNLFAKTMLAEVDGLDEENVRVMTIGNLDALPKATREAFEKAWKQTCENTGMTLVVAVNYGGRGEILDAANACAREAYEAAKSGKDFVPISADAFSNHLYTSKIPDPDLLIRTSGERRISNFLLWQSAYTEFVCTPVLWPDFDRYELLRCLLDYQKRSRRFGAVE
ncbi:MAG: isoprenyl transferase [Eggerthellaceae bacterium]